MEKSLIIKIAVFVVILIAGVAMVNHTKSQVNYLDFDCPSCGSSEVGNYGHYDQGTKGHCFDCGQEFYVEDTNE